MSNRTTIDQLSNVISRELTIYSNEITDGIKEVAKESIKQLVKETKATAPVGNRTKHYRDNITSKKMSDTRRAISYLWYVKGSDYRLSHLLNNGHQLRNGGRYEGTNFIGKASDTILEEYEKKVEEVIKNGG